VFRPCFLIALTLVPAQIRAADFVPPPGCETFLTVQHVGCKVSNYYRCTAEPAGHQWRVDFGINGRSYETLIDAEARWLYSYSPGSGISATIEPNEPDPASFSGLLATGYDSIEFFQSESDGTTHHYTAFDRLTGETTVIDGVTLLRTEYEILERDGEGNFIRRVNGREYVSEEFGRFFGGISQIEDWTGDSYPSDSTPIEFIRPGEPGFAATVPLFHCHDMMSQLAPFTGGDDAEG
jgi:hypothetical protein